MPKLAISKRHEFFNWVPLNPDKKEGYELGRGRNVDIKLPGHSDISRTHARIFYNADEEQWYLQDTSLFGTFLNGHRVPNQKPVKLSFGDSIRIHDYLLIFNMESSIFVADVSNVYDSPLPFKGTSKFEKLVSKISERMGQLSQDGAFFVRYIAETVRKSFEVDNCFVGIYEEGESRFEHAYNDSNDHTLQGRQFRPSQSFLSVVRNEQRALSSVDVPNDPDFKNFDSLVRAKVRTAVCIPILGNAGVLYLDSRSANLQKCTDEDLEFLCNLCGVNGIIGFLVNSLRQVGESQHDVLVPFSPKLSEIVDEIYRNFARNHENVLILGESGTGKELAARLIHRYSDRAAKPFIAFNCTAIPPTLFDDALFGHLKGTYSGASGDRKGFYETAIGGTLFIDEIGDLDLNSQTKLLRVIQNGEIQRIGCDQPIKIPQKDRPRLIFATNRDLRALVEEGKFREDLYRRMNRSVIRMPPLREMTGHLPVLLPYMIRRQSLFTATKVKHISQEALSLLQNYTWPGNIRELESVLQNALAACEGETLRPRHLNLEAQSSFASLASYPTVVHLDEEIEKSASSCEVPTLIEGEDGWERNVVARAIHHKTMRVGDPFIVVDASTLSLKEEEHDPNDRSKCAFLPHLVGGTIFIDRVESLPMRFQRSLLHHLDEWNMRNLGIIRGKREIKWLFGTNADLARSAKEKAFDPELYQTVAIHRVTIPPLWRRREEIELLLKYFLDCCSKQDRISKVEFAPETIEILRRYSWPGQVRELRRVVEFIAMNLRNDQVIAPQHLPPWLQSSKSMPGRLEIEIARVIATVYVACGRNKSKSAQHLDVDRRTVDKYLKIAQEHGIAE